VTTERYSDLTTLSSKTFWGKLKVNHDVPELGFKSVLENVLPDFWNPGMESRSKTSIMPELKSYLAELETKVNAAMPNERQAILEECVKVNKTSYLSNERAALQSFQKHGELLFESFGVDIGEDFCGFGGIPNDDWEKEAKEYDDLSSSESEIEYEDKHEHEEEW